MIYEVDDRIARVGLAVRTQQAILETLVLGKPTRAVQLVSLS
jgi:hypothetical protein